MQDYKVRAFRVVFVLLSYTVSVLSIVMVLEDNISKPERIFFLFLWWFTCRVGDKVRLDLKEDKKKDENIR